MQEGKEVIYTNVGNTSHAGTAAITFGEPGDGILSLVFDGESQCNHRFPDVVERAKLYLSKMNGGLGAYTDSKGNPYIRQEIAVSSNP